MSDDEEEPKRVEEEEGKGGVLWLFIVYIVLCVNLNAFVYFSS